MCPGRAPLEAIQGVAVEAVVPLFRAAVDAAEQHILRMHAQDFGAASAPAVAGASPYMADLTRHIALCRCAAAAFSVRVVLVAASSTALSMSQEAEVWLWQASVRLSSSHVPLCTGRGSVAEDFDYRTRGRASLQT